MNRQTALDILNANADSLPNLIEQAYQLRTKYKGNRVSIQLLTNVRSGNCTQNCAYCAQSLATTISSMKCIWRGTVSDLAASDLPTMTSKNWLNAFAR